MGWPPIATTAPSVLTRVRVERLEKGRAMVLLERLDRRGHVDGSPDARWVDALSISVRSSSGVRLDMDSKCRGAGREEVDWLRICR